MWRGATATWSGGVARRRTGERGGVALGGLGLMTGAGLYVADEVGGAAPREAPAAPARRLQVQPWILSDGAGTGVSGSF